MDRNGYIGRAPADSSVIVARQVFSPSGVTTDFTFTSGYTPGYLDLYLNGSRLVEGTDYTATDTSTISVLNGGADGGDVIEAVAYKAFNVATATVGISSAGTSIGSVNSLNFVGTGNTFALRGSTIDISISGSSGGGGGGVASTITVADESSDTTCFPVFVTAATGNLNPKSGSNLTFNSSNGTLTATTFGGNLTGNSAGSHTGAVDLNGGVLTLDADADTTITADTDDQIDIAFGGNDRITLSTGLIDLKNDGSQSALRLYCESSNAHYAALQAPAHSAFSGNITLTLPATTDTLIGRTTTDTLTNKTLTAPTITGTASFTGNVSIAGTLTYEDVTNIDSIGIITARSAIVLSENNAIHYKGTSGDDLDAILRESSSNTLLINSRNSARINIDSNNDGTGATFKVGTNGATGSTTDLVTILEDGKVGFGTNNPQTGLHISDGSSLAGPQTTGAGRLTIQNSASADIQLMSANTGYNHIFFGDQDDANAGVIYYQHNSGVNAMVFTTNAAERLRIASSGQIGIAGANYGTSGQVLTSKGSGSSVAWESVSVGLTTEAATVTNGQTTLLDLGSAQDHKLTCTGTVTISCTGGTQADSHTVRIINSGITTVGFSTYFLFPSGSTPSLPTADGAISLISFTVNRVGAAGTQLLAGASLNYS